MARTRVDDVRAIIETGEGYDGTLINIVPFIEVANILTDKVEDCAADRGLTLSSAQLRAIEQYLAAHLYAIRDPQYTSKRTERAAATFQGKTAMSLDYTPWGQMAKTLDTSGCLEAFGDQEARVQVSWMGLPPSDQTDYVDRD